MSQWVLFKLYDRAATEPRRVLVNLDRVEKIVQPPGTTFFEMTTADGRAIQVETTADELLMITGAQVLAH